MRIPARDEWLRRVIERMVVEVRRTAGTSRVEFHGDYRLAGGNYATDDDGEPATVRPVALGPGDQDELPR